MCILDPARSCIYRQDYRCVNPMLYFLKFKFSKNKGISTSAHSLLNPMVLTSKKGTNPENFITHCS